MPDTKEKPRQKLEIGQISDEILEKYNRPGPRYTSYPTAPVWKDDFGPDDLENLLRTRRTSGAPRFRSTCIFPSARACAFFARAMCRSRRTRAVAIPYLAALKKEIEHVAGTGLEKPQRESNSIGAAARRPISRPRKWKISFCYTRERFTFAPDAEIGIEIDPRVTNRAHLETLRRLGFNRLSMGIQDFQPKVQETIHRVQPYEMTRDLIVAARELGFESLNVDLIYGLPYQTAESFQATIDQVLTLAPDRVAMFSYAHVPWLQETAGLISGAPARRKGKIPDLPRGPGAVSRCRLPLHRHGPFRAAGRRARHRAAEPHAAPQFSGLHHQSGRGPLRHGRERHQLDRRGLRAEPPRGARVPGQPSRRAASPPCAATGFPPTT